MCLLYALMLSSISINALHLVSSNVIQVKCDSIKHPNGCDHSTGVCKEGFTKLKDGSCLESKMIGQDCTSSAQCLVPNSACFATDPALNRWQCQCGPEFWFKVSSNEGNDTNNETESKQSCEQRLSFGQNCQQSNQCSEQLFCSPSEHRCVCEQDFHFDSKQNKCFHKNYTKCEENKEWNQHLKKCTDKVHYSHRGTSGGGSGARAGVGGRSSGSKGWFGNNSGHRIKCNANVYLYSIMSFAFLLIDTKRIAFTISY